MSNTQQALSKCRLNGQTTYSYLEKRLVWLLGSRSPFCCLGCTSPLALLPARTRVLPGHSSHSQSYHQPWCLLLPLERPSPSLHALPQRKRESRKRLACLRISSISWHHPCLLPLPPPACLLSSIQKVIHTFPKYHCRAGIQSLLLSEIHCALATWQSLQTAQWVIL